MSDFERDIIQCLNRFFTTHHLQGFSYRVKPQKGIRRVADILVDSAVSSYNLSIGCISIKDKKLYFSQHFHAGNDNVHPVEAMSAFLGTTGRTGFLAIEYRHGPDAPHESFLIPWETVVEHYNKNQGITKDDARKHIALKRYREGYVLDHF